MRLFIAIELSDALKQRVAGIQDTYRRQSAWGRFTPPENMHLTLAFIGEYGDPSKVLDVLQTVSFEPFRISMDHVGCFSDLHWVGIADSPELNGLARQIRHALADAGIPFDRKRFRAHITFVRKVSFPRGGAIRQMTIEPADMEVNEFCLMMSTPGKNGMIYTKLGTVEAE